MITSTSLTHINTQARLFAAMQQARIKSLNAKSGLGGHVIHNKKGKSFLLVTHNRGKEFKKGFTFYSMKNSKNISKTVLTSLRG